MKIAIIGAGISGLSCAHELERYNIIPDIYEDLDFIGDREPHITATVNILDRPIKDALDYYRDVYHITLQPLNIIKKLTHISPSEKAIFTSNKFGYFFKRGKEPDSAKQQLYALLKNPNVLFGQKPDLNTLSKEYDFVAVADGRPDIARQMGIWNDWIYGWVQGAVVEGDFDQNEIIMWINRKFCKTGYAYLCPYSEKKATLLLFMPYVTKEQAKYYWSQFWLIENLQYKIVEEFMIDHYSGWLTKYKVNNIYFIGNSGGAVSPFLGFGQLNSITMGVLAAKSMVEGFDYQQLISFVLEKEKDFYEIRKAFDKMSNDSYNTLLQLLKIPGVKQLAYDTNINVIKLGGKALRLYEQIKNNKP